MSWTLVYRGWNLFYLRQLDLAIDAFRQADLLKKKEMEMPLDSIAHDDVMDTVRHSSFNFLLEEDVEEWLCESLKLKAKTLLSKSDSLGQVVAAIDELLVLRPDKEYYVAMKATALVALKRYEDACLQLSLAIDLNPRHPPYYVNRAYTYYKLSLFSHALKDYQSALELDAKCEEAIEGIEKTMAAKKKAASKFHKAARFGSAHEAA